MTCNVIRLQKCNLLRCQISISTVLVLYVSNENDGFFVDFIYYFLVLYFILFLLVFKPFLMFRPTQQPNMSRDIFILYRPAKNMLVMATYSNPLTVDPWLPLRLYKNQYVTIAAYLREGVKSSIERENGYGEHRDSVRVE